MAPIVTANAGVSTDSVWSDNPMALTDLYPFSAFIEFKFISCIGVGYALLQCKRVKSLPYFSTISKICPNLLCSNPIPIEIIKGNLVEATISTNLQSVDSNPDIFNLLTPNSTNSSTACSSKGVDMNSISNLSQYCFRSFCHSRGNSISLISLLIFLYPAKFGVFLLYKVSDEYV